jgi:GntR family transcriptional regulator/MocR family aminotransferase
MNTFQLEPVWGQLLPKASRKDQTLQRGLRMNLVQAIIDGRITTGTRLPSTRELAGMLGIARVTVALTYERLVAEGYLAPRDRQGYFVCPVTSHAGPLQTVSANEPPAQLIPSWPERFATHHAHEKWLEKPRDWRNYQYPFVYGQPDPKLFPLAQWRECSRVAQGIPDSSHWSADAIDVDDPMLIAEIQNRVLTKRGIVARPEEILITMGTQMALYLIAEIFMVSGTPVAIEDPGYMDARNILLRRQAKLVCVAVDDAGVVPGESLKQCAYMYCTPSHQCPTGVTLTTERRLKLLELAGANDSIIIEDDYDAETQFVGQPSPALKAIDRSGRVIYIGSFSKILSPGLRIGYLVADRAVIEQARRLRRLIVRHPPINNQRALAIFISHGYYDRLLADNRLSLQTRAAAITESLRQFLPDWKFREPLGGSALWLQAPDSVRMPRVELAARRRGVVIEGGAAFFHSLDPPTNYVRVAYSSIPLANIRPGIETLASVVHECETPRRPRARG